jgi:hypothetical protein
MDQRSRQDREPKIGRQGSAYASLLDGNLMVNVKGRNIFDLTVQDGRDLIAALHQAIDAVEAQR